MVVLTGVAGILAGVLVMYSSSHFFSQANQKDVLLVFSLIVSVPVVIKGLKQRKARA